MRRSKQLSCFDWSNFISPRLWWQPCLWVTFQEIDCPPSPSSRLDIASNFQVGKNRRLNCILIIIRYPVRISGRSSCILLHHFTPACSATLAPPHPVSLTWMKTLKKGLTDWSSPATNLFIYQAKEFSMVPTTFLTAFYLQKLWFMKHF